MGDQNHHLNPDQDGTVKVRQEKGSLFDINFKKKSVHLEPSSFTTLSSVVKDKYCLERSQK